MKYIITSVLVALSFIGFMPTLQHWVLRHVSWLRPSTLPWVGLLSVTGWTYIVIPSPYRGYLLGCSLLAVGLLFALGSTWVGTERFRNFIANAFFAGRDVFHDRVFNNQGWTLFGVGLAIAIPSTTKALDTIAILSLLGWFVYRSIKMHNDTEEAIYDMAEDTQI